MAKRKNRSSTHTFVLGMIIYALIFMVIGAVGLRFLWSYMEEYERSRPNNTMDKYIQSFDEEHIKRVSADFVATLDHKVQTEEESYDYIVKAMDGQLSYGKKSAESNDNKAVYVISLDGKKLGTVVLTKQDDPTFGFSPWSVTEEEMDFSRILASKTITVPDSWTVSCNDNVLDSSYLSGEERPYAILKEFYEDRLELPCMVTYHVENFVGDIEFELKNEDGQVVTLPEGEENEAIFTDNCTEQEKDELYALAENFVRGYVCFMSNTSGYAYANYMAVREYIVPDSELDSRLYQTIEGQNYASSNGDEIVSITLNDSMDLGDGNYYADVTYVVDTTGQKGVVQTTLNLKLIISQTDSGLKVAAVASY